MSFEQWRPVWERARSGQHTLILGPSEVPSRTVGFAHPSHQLRDSAKHQWPAT